MAETISADRCTAVYGGERMSLADGVTLRVVRWNHSGDSATNPEQHNPIELDAVPRPDPQTGGLRAGVAEDFPNGGGNRAFLFVVDGAEGRFSWFYQNSASADDLQVPIVVGGANYGAPLENLRVGTEGRRARIGRLMDRQPRLTGCAAGRSRSQAEGILPVHWDGLWGAFEAGVPQPFSDPALEAFLQKAGVQVIGAASIHGPVAPGP